MKQRFLKIILPIGTGIGLFILIVVGLQGCEGGACSDATSSLDSCIDCLNRKCNGCAASGGYIFVQGSKCECN